MEHNEIITMLEDIGTCFGGRNFKEIKEKEGWATVKCDFNGVELKLEYFLNYNSVIISHDGSKRSWTPFYGSYDKNQSAEGWIASFIKSYIEYLDDKLTQSDLNMIANIDIKEIKDALNSWL